MAVAFMAALEQSPETYDKEFDDVLGGRQSLVHERILQYIRPGMLVLDLGCGPGSLAIEITKRGAAVLAVDSSEGMIETARRAGSAYDNPPDFYASDVLRFIEILIGTTVPSDSDQDNGLQLSGQFDLVVSTFLLSELKPHKRLLLLRTVRSLLKENGIFVFASETLPEERGEEREFWRKRSKAEKLAQRRFPTPIDDLSVLAKLAGLSVASSESFGPEITLVIGVVGESKIESEYEKRDLAYFGVRTRGRIWYNHLTGGWRGIPIKPGLYRAGNPTAESPVIVTANYELTYYTVMRALHNDGVAAWVLVCETNGINVWCAARGVHFDTDDVVEMVQLTRLSEIVSHRELILPQLSAAGMDPTEIRQRTGFRSFYGPVRIQDLGRWLELEKPKPKPRDMATVTFNLRERMEQSVAHVPFLFAVLLGRPLIRLLGLLLVGDIVVSLLVPQLIPQILLFSTQAIVLIIEFIVALVGNALFLGLVFPLLPSKGNSFWRRGWGLAAMTVPLSFIIMALFNTYWTVVIVWLMVQTVLSISLTMDFSGMTSVSDPMTIRREYPYLVRTLIIGVCVIVGFNILVVLMGW